MSNLTEFTTNIPLKDKLHFAAQFSFLFTIRLAAILLGFIVVPIALHFSKKRELDKPVIIPVEVNGTKLDLCIDHTVQLPKWAWLWDNYEEGCASTYAPYWQKCKGRANSYWNMIFWSCIRNPANNMRFTKMFQCDMLNCKHEYKEYANSFYCKSTDLITGKVYYSFRRRKWYEHKGQNVSSILHLGFKVLKYNIDKLKNQPEIYKMEHHRKRGFSLQAIPRRGFRK